MQNLIEFNKDLMSSREIASLTGKTHKNVLADCDKLNENYIKMSMAEISAVEYRADNMQFYRELLLTKMQSMDLMTGYSIDLRIKVNRRWQELEEKQTIPETQIKIPQTFAEALRLAADMSEQKERLEIENARLHERTDFIDIVFTANDLLSCSEVCKILNLSYGNKTLFKKLRESGIFFKNRNEPKQIFVDKGYFRMKENLYKDKVTIQTFFTQKGLGYVAKFLGVIVPKINRVKFID